MINITSLKLSIVAYNVFLLEWVKTGEPSGAEVPVERSDAPSSGWVRIDKTNARCYMRCVGANILVNNESFTLTKPDNTQVVFRFRKNGGTIGAGVPIDITTGDDYEKVAELITAAINTNGNFTAVQEITTVVITQKTPGSAGNKSNSDTVEDEEFVLGNFICGKDANVDAVTYFEDDDPLNYQRNLPYYYRLQNPSGGYTNIVNTPFQYEKHVYGLINMATRHLKRDLESKSWLFKIKHYGEECTSCHDKLLNQSIVNNCPVCYGVGFTGGYSAPIEVYVAYSPVSEEKIDTGYGKFNIVQMPSWTIGYPTINDNDILLRDRDKEMFRVVQPIRRTGRRMFIARQTFNINGIDHGSVEYNLLSQVP